MLITLWISELTFCQPDKDRLREAVSPAAASCRQSEQLSRRASSLLCHESSVGLSVCSYDDEGISTLSLGLFLLVAAEIRKQGGNLVLCH